MRSITNLFIFAVAAIALLAGPVLLQAKELVFLQTDPRFTGGEVNLENPSKPNFWFYDQYAAARHKLEDDGVKMVPISTITLPALTAESNAFYMPAPTNPQASVYPATDSELDTIKQYVLSGRSVIFNLTGSGSEAMANNLFSRLGLNFHQANDSVSGGTSFPDPHHPILKGPHRSISSFNWNGTGYVDSLGNLRSLVNVGERSVLPYVEKGELTKAAGGFFFILDGAYLPNYTKGGDDYQNLFRNLVDYAIQDQYLRYVPGAAVAKPRTLYFLSVGAMALFARRRRIVA